MGIPSGIVALLFTDIEDSTRLWASDPDGMERSLARHDGVVRSAIEAESGYVFGTGGDSFAAAFGRSTEAIEAASRIQASLAEIDWGSDPKVFVRIGVHVGEAYERDGNYFGPAVNTAARVAAAGHGGQILVTEQVRSAAHVVALELGEFQLRGVDGGFRLYQIGEGTFGPLRCMGATIVVVPSPRTSLVGRDREVTEVRRLMTMSRLVTLTGVGGCGKTRVAVEVARQEVPASPGGVWFIDLSAVTEGAGLAGAVAATLDLSIAALADPTEQIGQFLASRKALLVVDNCEHLLADVAELADRLLDAASGLRVLTTSRESLGLDGERAWRVPSLAVGADSAAVALFNDRASASGGPFEPNVATLAVVSDICDRLDGMPLAIELAAVCVRTMSVTEIRDRLDDRFTLLAGGQRFSRQRQRTLEAAVQWSYDLLEPAERQLLRNLAVFNGGFDLADVPAVGDISNRAAVQLVNSLVSKSLVDTIHASDGSVRLRLLETIRHFALDRLVAENGAVEARDRHLEHFLADPVVLDFGEYLSMVGQERVHREIDNFRAAAVWASEQGRLDATVRIACALFDALPQRGELGLVLDWLQLPASLESANAVRAQALVSVLRIQRLDAAGGEHAALAAIEMAAGEPHNAVPYAYLNLAAARAHLGHEDYLPLVERAIEISAQTSAPDWNAAISLLYRSIFHTNQFRFNEASADADLALRLAPGLGFRHVIEAWRAYSFHLADRPIEARRAVKQFSKPSPVSPWSYLNETVTALVASTEIGPSAACRLLAAAALDSVAKRPQFVGDWLCAFALLAVERGDFDRAIEIVENCAPVSPGLHAPAYARAFGWPLATSAELYHQRMSDDAYGHVARAGQHQSRLVAEELDRWSPLRFVESAPASS